MALLRIHVNDGFLPMVDGSLVYHRGFGDRPTATDDPSPSLALTPRVLTADGRSIASRHYPLNAALPPHGRPAPAYRDPFHPGEYLVHRRHWASYFPERTIVVESGAAVVLRVHNHLAQPHALSVLGAAPGGGHLGTGPIAPGRTGELAFDAPAPGIYLYCDPGADPANPDADPVQRVLGLYGGLLVVDPEQAWAPWPGGPEFERQWLWLLHTVDPEWARLASQGREVDPEAVPAYPRYFTLNGRSGFQSLGLTLDEDANREREEDTLMSGSAREVDARDFNQAATEDTIRAGQLMRFVNAGVVHHQLHFHGNHLWTLRRNGFEFPRRRGSVDAEGHILLQQWEDVIEVHPGDRKECVLPFHRPREAVRQVWDARAGDWHFPMHCHAEPSQVARGGMYPGGLVGHWTIAEPADVPDPPGPVVPPPDDTAGPPEPSAPPGSGIRPPAHPRFASQAAFASAQLHEGSPETEFLQRGVRRHELKVVHDKIEFPGAGEFEMMMFELDDGGRVFPSPLIRVTEGEVYQAEIKPQRRVHTVHWHGIEPDPRNDGVGHTSFEVTGGYTYQWRPEPGVPGDPNPGTAGSYFYHCHVNTTLHVQLGMFGPLVVDPIAHPDYPVDPGARRAFVDGPQYDVDTETLLVPYALDPRWHELNHAAGLSGEDVGLDRFEPEHFFILGGELARPPADRGAQLLTRIRATVPGGPNGRRPTLLRFLNANYFPVNAYFADAAGNPAPIGELIAHDGRPYWDTGDPSGPAIPAFRTARGRLTTPLLNFGAAERFEMLLRPPAPGAYTLTVDLLHWITGKVLFRRVIPVTAE